MKVAIIPARGGSKRIPQKNIRDFCGQPVINWSISAARQSGVFDRIIVSTDCEKIASIARQAGAEVPFMRPAQLADDFAPTRVVVNHALEWLNTQNQAVEYACCLYATAPLVTADSLREGLSRLIAAQSSFCFTVTAYPYPIQRALMINGEDKIQMFYPQHRLSRSQDLEPAYHDAGQFYWGKAQAFLADTVMYSEHAVPLVLPRWQVQDIDTEEDWIFAEQLFNRLRAKK